MNAKSRTKISDHQRLNKVAPPQFKVWCMNIYTLKYVKLWGGRSSTAQSWEDLGESEAASGVGISVKPLKNTSESLSGFLRINPARGTLLHGEHSILTIIGVSSKAAARERSPAEAYSPTARTVLRLVPWTRRRSRLRQSSLASRPSAKPIVQSTLCGNYFRECVITVGR